jgi:CDP-diglyceride synthetase
MLSQRLISVAIIVPLLIASIIFGGWWLTAFVGLFIGIAAWEYGKLFMSGDFHPSLIILVAGCLSLIVARLEWDSEGLLVIIAVLVLTSMVWHTISYQRGISTSATDFVITLAGCLYLGFTAGYIISIFYR